MVLAIGAGVSALAPAATAVPSGSKAAEQSSVGGPSASCKLGNGGKHVIEITFDNVLLVGGDSPRVGKPFVAGVKVMAEVVAQDRAKKVTVFKFRRRKNYRRKAGHRQPFTELRITGIEG